jgi:hypothetical protein
MLITSTAPAHPAGAAAPWKVFGKGPVSGKAEPLMCNTAILERAGAITNPRRVITSGVFGEFRERAGVPQLVVTGAAYLDFAKAIHSTPFLAKERDCIAEAMSDFSGIPIIVRSSTPWEPRGCGFCTSQMCANNSDSKANMLAAEATVKGVLASEFSPDSMEHKRKFILPHGMDILIEPVFGQPVGGRISKFDLSFRPYFGPLNSGIAYTSTASGKRYALVSAGLPILPVQGEGFLIYSDEVEGVISKRDLSAYFTTRDPRAAWSQSDFDAERWKMGRWLDLETGTISSAYISDLRGFGLDYLRDLFLMLDKLEQGLGHPHYLEFAVIKPYDKPLMSVLQLAKLEYSEDYFELSESEHTVARSNFVATTGARICPQMVFIDSLDKKWALAEFNSRNNGYLLAFTSNLSSSSNSNPLAYSNFSNAAAAVEVFTKRHDRHPAAHFEGGLEQGGVLFMVTNKIDLEKLAPYGSVFTHRGASMPVYSVPFDVVADAHKEKGIINLRP